VVTGNLDEVGAVSPSVIKAATILTNSSLQRWKTSRNLKSSVRRSLSELFDETSDLCDTDRRREGSNYDKIAKGGERSGAKNTITSCGSSVRKNTKAVDCEEFTICNKSSSHRSIGIQVESKDAEPLRIRRPIIRRSTASQTHEQRDTISFAASKNVAEKNTASSLVSNPNGSSRPSLESTTTINDATLSRTDQDTAVSFAIGHGLVRNQLQSEGTLDNDITTEAFSRRSFPTRTDLLTKCGTNDINLRCDEVIDDKYIELNEEKSKKEMSVQLQETNQDLQLKFVDEFRTIFLDGSEEQPLRFLTCL
jgi:hypothetical protein